MRLTSTQRPTGQRSAFARTPRGFTLLGLLFWATLVSMLSLVALRVIPTVTEYNTIRRTVNKVAKSGGNTVPEIRASFERARSVEFGMAAISGQDLQITKDNDEVVIAFAYDKEIELFGPVFLLIKYRGSSR